MDTFETFDIAPMPGSQGTMCRSPTRVPAFTCMDRFRHTHPFSALSSSLLLLLLLVCVCVCVCLCVCVCVCGRGGRDVHLFFQLVAMPMS